MSSMPPTDGPSEEEVRAYLAEMRAAPAEQVVVELIQSLLNAAQVKLGRNDARLLIDVAAAIMGASRAHVRDEIARQVDQALSQLRLGQVEAEHEVAQAKAQGHTEPNDLDPAPGGAAAAQEAPGTPPSQPSAASKLWLPGR